MVEFLLDIQEIRRPESIYTLSANWWSSIKDLKDKIFSLTHEPPSRQHIYHSTNPVELHNNQILHDLGIEQSGRMLRVAIDYRSRSEFTLTPTKGVFIDDACKEMLRNVRLGLQRNRKPKMTDEFEGSGGVYFLRSANGAYEAVFKPHDEEQGMPANPKDHVGAGKEGLREHFLPGQGCLRELAAYIMDYQSFCRVPATTLVHCEHQGFHYPVSGSKVGSGDPYPKLGSLQRFIHGAELFEDLGPALLSDIEVQKIALLDMRILNCDRNAANILVKYTQVQEYHDVSKKEDLDDHFSFLPHSDSDEYPPRYSPHSSPQSSHKTGNSGNSSVYELYPIDHGYAMPSHLKIFEWDWAWLYYPHVNREVAPEIVTYVESLDIDELLNKLEPQVPLSDDSVFLLRLSHYLVLHGIRAGLTLKDIAMTIARSDEDVASKLELSVNEAEENAYRSIELKSSSWIKGSNTMAPPHYSSSPKSTSNENISPRSTVDVSPVKSMIKDEIPEFPLSISLNLLRDKENDLALNSSAKDNESTDKGSHVLSSTSGDDHTTLETDSSSASSDRLSPAVTSEGSHAINHSPMRPHLSSSSSWNSFTSFHAPQPPLYSYAMKSKDRSRDTSLGMSPRRKDVESKYLPPTGKPAVIVENVSNSSSLFSNADEEKHVTVPPLPCTCIGPHENRKLDTIIEYARERGLSSLSNSSTVSHESDYVTSESLQYHHQQQQQQSVTTTVPSVSSDKIENCVTSCSEKSEILLPQPQKSSDSLGGIVLDLEAESEVDLRHASLPNNALRRMNAMSGNVPVVTTQSSRVVPPLEKNVHIDNSLNVPGDALADRTDSIGGMHVDLGVPLFRSQRSIDSSAMYGRNKRTWAPDLHSPQSSPKLTRAALLGNNSSSPAFGLSPKRMSSNSLCSSNSGNGGGDEYSSDYGFFKNFAEGTDFSNPVSPKIEESTVNYGEFSGIDLPSKDENTDDGAGFDDLCAPVSLARVVSFSGFESAPVYNNMFAGTMGNLRLERRKAIAKTKEFMQLRLQFAQEHISSIIQRMKREKESRS